MPDLGDQLRAEIRTLQAQRRSLESKLMQPQPRTSPAYYLSRSECGRSKLTYVKKEDLDTVRQRCAAYRVFQQNLRVWRQITATLEQRWKQLQRAQSR